MLDTMGGVRKGSVCTDYPRIIKMDLNGQGKGQVWNIGYVYPFQEGYKTLYIPRGIPVLE